MGETKEQLLARAARFGKDGWICWACSGPVAEPVVKRRVDHGPHFAEHRGSNRGVYHKDCKPRRDDLKPESAQEDPR